MLCSAMVRFFFVKLQIDLQPILQKLIDHFDNLLQDDDNGSDLLNEEFWVSTSISFSVELRN